MSKENSPQVVVFQVLAFGGLPLGGLRRAPPVAGVLRFCGVIASSTALNSAGNGALT